MDPLLIAGGDRFFLLPGKAITEAADQIQTQLRDRWMPANEPDEVARWLGLAAWVGEEGEDEVFYWKLLQKLSAN